MIRSIDHVQIAMPPGEEDRARAFYTLHGDKLRFLKELEAQDEQRIEFRFMSGHGFVQASRDSGFE
ncbi:MAG: hypothetical protein FJZ87_14770, partial [Chloroflexi bacterium]|nr:hypothetical protein [Chloroflexota bacterium]